MKFIQRSRCSQPSLTSKKAKQSTSNLPRLSQPTSTRLPCSFHSPKPNIRKHCPFDFGGCELFDCSKNSRQVMTMIEDNQEFAWSCCKNVAAKNRPGYSKYKESMELSCRREENSAGGQNSDMQLSSRNNSNIINGGGGGFADHQDDGAKQHTCTKVVKLIENVKPVYTRRQSSLEAEEEKEIELAAEALLQLSRGEHIRSSSSNNINGEGNAGHNQDDGGATHHTNTKVVNPLHKVYTSRRRRRKFRSIAEIYAKTDQVKPL